MAVDDQVLDSALDRLFGASLDEFTATRDALAKQLRSSGHPAAAKAIAGLRKPAVPAWAVNQLARRFAREVRDLLAAGERLRELQLAGLAGRKAQELQAAAQAERRLVTSLTERAGALLAEAGLPASTTHLDAIRTTLSAAASLPDEQRALIARGRLERPLSPAGFGDLLAGALNLPAAPPPAGRPSSGRRQETRPPVRPVKREREDEQRQRAMRRRELEARLSRLRDAHAGAAKAAKVSAERAHSLEKLVETLDRQFAQARREREAANAESGRAAAAAQEAARKLREAEAELESP